MAGTPQNFGWIPFEDRTREQAYAAAAAKAEMPKFQIVGRSNYGEGRAFLFDLWTHPQTVEALGFAYPGNHQLTGSCVGAGGGNALFTLIAGDAISRGEPEEIVVPFWLLPYGRSRFYMGDRNPGEGSMGGTFAKAVREDGTLNAKNEIFPRFKNTDGLIWGESVEMAWSDGDAKQTLDLLESSRKHVVRTTAECSSADDVREAIVNGYPCTAASDWGGRMKCRVQGTPEVLLNDRVTDWAHQMSVQGWWDHPSLGEIFWIQNQWGLEVHGRDPAGGPGGGFWILKKDMDSICRSEVFAFSGFDGFPSRFPPWDWKNNILV